MFTGLIEEIGTVRAVRPISGGVRIEIEAPRVAGGCEIGDSIDIDGACQTVVRVMPPRFTVEAVGETLEKTTLGDLKQGRRVHLERAMRAGDRMGGHLVQGHVSGVGVVRSAVKRGDNWLLSIGMGPELLELMVPEGSVALDGVSLTVATVDDEGIEISIVPHTAAQTLLVQKGAGAPVNIETDIIGRYVRRFVGAYTRRPVAQGRTGAPRTDEGRETAGHGPRSGLSDGSGTGSSGSGESSGGLTREKLAEWGYA